MKFFTLDRSVGGARACVCSIACRVGLRNVGPLARRGRVEVLGSEFLEVLASAPDPRDPRGRRYPLAGLLAICGPGNRGAVCAATPGSPPGPRPRRRKCLPGWGFGSGGPSEKTFRSVPSRQTGSGRSRPPPGRLLHDTGRRAGGRRGRTARGGDGRQDAARRASHGRGRRAPGGGVRPPHPAGARPAPPSPRRATRSPCVRELLRSFRNVRLLVTIDAMHTQTTTAAICSH